MSNDKTAPCWCGNDSAFTDKITLRDYCLECSLDPKRSSMNVYLQLIDLTIPFVVGDRVDCHQAGDKKRPLGTGIIVEIDTDFKEGGTPYYPVYRVEFEEQEDKWLTAICMRRTG